MSITLAELKQRSRERADAENSVHTDPGAELTAYINSSIAELHDLLIGCYGSDYYVESCTFNTINGTDTYALPDGTLYSGAKPFYKLMGVDARINGNAWYTLRPFNFNERNRNEDISWGLLTGPTIRYRLVGSDLKFSPVPDANAVIKLWYVPPATKLVQETDVLQDLNQYYEYIITDVAIKIMQKEESDVSVLAAQKLDLRKRIENMAQNRDVGNPESVSDIYAENDDYWFTRG